MRVHCKLSSISLLAILLLSLCFVGLNTAFAQTNQVDSKLQAANVAVNQAFNAVLDAEKAGANVTDLHSRLNYALGIIAQAETSYRTGYFNKASAQADNVLPLAQQITLDAQSAKQTAIVLGQNTFWFTIALTVIGVFVFVLVLFLVWRWFKRGYITSLSEAKPEVVNQ